jgi:hypothetical protein
LDELWNKDIRETKAQLAARAEKVIDQIFDENAQEICMSFAPRFRFVDGLF